MARPARDIPWLGKRDNGTYYVFWHDKQTGRTDRFSLRSKDADEARAAYITFLSDGKGIFEAPRTDHVTVARALDDYEREHVREKCADPVRQRSAINNLKAHFGDAPLRAVDVDASRRYRADRLSGDTGGGKRRKPAPARLATIRRELVVLVAAANHARKRKRIEMNDLPQIELPDGGTDAKAEWYRPEELKLAITTAEGDFRKYLRILYYTAARRRSIEKLDLDQVDLEIDQINLAKAGERKTKKRRPVVPIFPEIKQDVAELVAAARAGGRKMLFGRDMYRDYRNHFESIGLDHKANPHIMRHTRASHMLRDGVSTWKVAKLLGDTEATVVRVYGHHLPQDLAEYGGDV